MTDVERSGDWAHRAVVGRFPAGIDPRTAIRAVVEAAHERTDGTNALPWWLRSDAVFWHGTGYSWVPVKGALVLPPSETGVIPAFDETDRHAVYVTTVRDDAVLYAMRHEMPVVLRCVVEREPQADDMLPDDSDSWRVSWARVVRCEMISRAELQEAAPRLAVAAARAELDRLRALHGVDDDEV